MEAALYLGGLLLLVVFLYSLGASAMVLVCRGKMRDLSTAAAIPVAISILALVAVVKLWFVPEGSWRFASLIPLALLVAAAVLIRGRALVRALLNPRLIVPGLLIFLVTSAYVTLPNDPSGITPYPRTFFWNPVKVLGADDHLQYRTAQFVQNRLDLQKDNFFFQWKISDRTPLTGLAFSEYASLMGERLPESPLYGLPRNEQRWQVPDEHSYWLYRLFVMLGNASILGAIGYLALRRFGEATYRVATAICLVGAFSILQVMMTYPKMLLAAMIVLAIALLLEGGPIWMSGGFTGLGYLVHPMTIVYVPGLLLLLLFLKSKPPALKQRLKNAAVWTLPFLIMAGAWHGWVAAEGVGSNRFYLYPLGAYTESDDPAEVQKAVDDALISLRENPVRHVLGRRAVSFAATFFSVPDFRCNQRPGDMLYCLGIWTLPGELGFAFALFAYASVLILMRRDPRVWVPIAVVTPLVVLAIWGIDGRALGPEFLHPLWAVFTVAGAWLLSRTSLVWRLLVISLGILQTILIALISFYHPTTFADDGIGTAGLVLFIAASAACIASALRGITIGSNESGYLFRAGAGTKAAAAEVSDP